MRWGGVVVVANAALMLTQLVVGRLLAPQVGQSLETNAAVVATFLLGIALGNALGGRWADAGPTPCLLRRVLLAGSAAIALIPLTAGLLPRQMPLPLATHAVVAALALGLPASFILSISTPLAIRLSLVEVAHTGRVVGWLYALGTLGSLLGTFATGFGLLAVVALDPLAVATAGVVALVGRWAGTGTGPPTEARPRTPSLRQLVSVPAAAPAPHVPALAWSTALLVVGLASFVTFAVEIAAVRVLAPVVGVSLHTWTGILGAVLLGMAVGNHWGGRWADAQPEVGLLGRVLLAAAVATFAILPNLALLTASHLADRLDPLPQTLLYALVLFTPPALCLGMVMPLTTRLAVPALAHAGRTAGTLYAVSCGGALVGVLVSAGGLMAWVGVYAWLFVLSLGLLALSLFVGQYWQARGSLFLAALVGLGACAGLSIAPQLAKGVVLETNYCAIAVIEKTWDGRQVRALKLDRLMHSLIDPTDPLYLGYPHQRIEAALIAQQPRADLAVLVIGGGGYSLPRWVEQTEPSAVVDVVEIDPGVTAVARSHLGLPDTPRIRPHHADGRQWVLQNPAARYRVVVQDAVNDLAVPWHLLTREYNESLHRMLTPDGVYCLTVLDVYEDGRFLRAIVRTLQATFPNVQVWAAQPFWDTLPHGRGQFVVVASRTPQPVPTGAFALSAGQVDAYAADVVTLTDQFAPVDWLLTPLWKTAQAE
jgi:spermidine synthase